MKSKTLAAGTAAAVVLALGACGSGGTSTVSTTAAKPKPALTAEQVASGMGIGSVKAYTAATDPNHLLGRQGEYTSKVNWSAGSVEVFSDTADASARQAYVQAFKCPFGDGYDYLDGVYLLRLDCSLTPA